MENAISDTLLDQAAKSRLRWRCRRGMLENDLFVERFLHRFESTLTVHQAACLMELMELGDNDLLDLHLGRKELAHIDADLDRDEVRSVLRMLREKPLKGRI